MGSWSYLTIFLEIFRPSLIMSGGHPDHVCSYRAVMGLGLLRVWCHTRNVKRYRFWIFLRVYILGRDVGKFHRINLVVPILVHGMWSRSKKSLYDVLKNLWKTLWPRLLTVFVWRHHNFNILRCVTSKWRPEKGERWSILVKRWLI